MIVIDTSGMLGYAVFFPLYPSPKDSLIISHAPQGQMGKILLFSNLADLAAEFGQPSPSCQGLMCAYELFHNGATHLNFMRVTGNPIDTLRLLADSNYVHAHYLQECIALCQDS